MSETAVRLLVVAAVAVLALVVARAAWWLPAWRAARRPIDLGGVEGRVVLFTDRRCTRCDTVRDMLTAAGVEFVEVRPDDDPDRWARTGVEAVPLLVVRDASGGVTGRIGGVPRRSRLGRLLRRAE
jgi:glutaredoxin